MSHHILIPCAYNRLSNTKLIIIHHPFVQAMHTYPGFTMVRQLLVIHTFLLSSAFAGASAQIITPADSTRASLHKNFAFQPKYASKKLFILPAALIATGAFGTSGKFIISNPEIKEERDQYFRRFHTSADNYLQYAPMAAGYALLMNNPQHHFWPYTKKVLLTEVIVTALVIPTKSLVKERRPDTGAPNSFPSGHTAQAFAGATIFCDEFATHDPWLKAGVYTGAAAVGFLRLLNNRHWASDVIAGAGFGMLSAKLSEWIVEAHGKKKIHQPD